jgi:stage II sporulation protein AB (anti-sigma F factor)
MKDKKHGGRPRLAPICNEMKLDFPSHSKNESFARAAAGAFIASLDPTASELSDIKCALSEAVTNCTVHAYRDTIGSIVMTAKAYGDRSVKIEIKDRGCGIEDISAAMQPMYTTDRENERSGLGFTVMESFCDKIRVVSKPAKGTKVTLIKTLSKIGSAT